MLLAIFGRRKNDGAAAAKVVKLVCVMAFDHLYIRPFANAEVFRPAVSAAEEQAGGYDVPRTARGCSKHESCELRLVVRESGDDRVHPEDGGDPRPSQKRHIVKPHFDGSCAGLDGAPDLLVESVESDLNLDKLPVLREKRDELSGNPGLPGHDEPDTIPEKNSHHVQLRSQHIAFIRERVGGRAEVDLLGLLALASQFLIEQLRCIFAENKTAFARVASERARVTVEALVRAFTAEISCCLRQRKANAPKKVTMSRYLMGTTNRRGT